MYEIEPYRDGWAISRDGRIVIETIANVEDAMEVRDKLNECVEER